jgi:predicted MPP superfamily phosphohydrolase
MRLQLISDLHTEFHRGSELTLIRHLPIEPYLDFLVVAGDVVVPGYQGSLIVEAIFAALAEKACHVLYVIGNHEYYRGSKAWTENKLREAMARHPNIHWLDNDELTLDGIHFYGGTMWYPVGDGRNHEFAKQIADSFEIQNFTWAETENTKFSEGLYACAKPETIVVSHHLPHPRTVPLKFVHSDTNRFFVSDQSHAIETLRPRLWFFGHTHEACDIVLDSTRAVCNPYGYPMERLAQPRYPATIFDV